MQKFLLCFLLIIFVICAFAGGTLFLTSLTPITNIPAAIIIQIIFYLLSISAIVALDK